MQNLVKEFNASMPVHKKTMPTMARILDIASELGELSKEYLKSSKYGTESPIITDDFALEFGDVLYSLLCLAEETGLDADKCLLLVLKKYKARIEKNGNMGSGN